MAQKPSKPADEKTLEAIRHCMHSYAQCAAKDLRPDYVCHLSRKPCKLYDGTFNCGKREEFPECMDR